MLPVHKLQRLYAVSSAHHFIAAPCYNRFHKLGGVSVILCHHYLKHIMLLLVNSVYDLSIAENKLKIN